jgi:hypothetical protein
MESDSLITMDDILSKSLKLDSESNSWFVEMQDYVDDYTKKVDGMK